MKRSRQVLALVALVVLGALVLASCGGGKSKRLTKAEFAAKTNTLCTAYRKDVNALGNPKTAAEALTMMTKYKVRFKKIVSDVKALKPPADEQSGVDRIMTISDQQLGLVDQMIAALKKNDLALFGTLVKQGDTLDKETNSIFERLGATACTK